MADFDPQQAKELLDTTADQAWSFKPEDRMAKMKLVRAIIRLFQSLEYLLTYTCKHFAAEIPGDYYKKDKWRSDGAHCAGCGKSLGWYCPKAPQHFCEYNDDEDPIHDYCLHCGFPEERK